MSNYTKSTDFASKDALPTGNAGKIVKGTEIDTEFNNIATAVATKADTSSPSFSGTSTFADISASGTVSAAALSVSGAATGVTASVSDDSTKFATTAFVRDIIPSGVIVMWSGTIANIPSGWYLCNGSNSTPDLRNKFIIAADADDSGTAKTSVTGSATQSGGSKDAVNVSHTHTATVSDPGHNHAYISGNTGSINDNLSTWTGILQNAGYDNTRDQTIAISAATTGISVSNSTEGSSGTNANLPPYYALAYIMKA